MLEQVKFTCENWFSVNKGQNNELPFLSHFIIQKDIFFCCLFFGQTFLAFLKFMIFFLHITLFRC